MTGLIHKYFAILRCLPLDPALYAEYGLLSKNTFQTAPESNVFYHAEQLARDLSQPYSRRELLSAPWIFTEWNTNLLNSVIIQLTPSKSRVTVMGRENWDDITLHGLPIDTDDNSWSSLPWYRTRYMVQRLYNPTYPLPPLEDAFSEGFLPSFPNPYTPQNVTVITNDKVRITRLCFIQKLTYNATLQGIDSIPEKIADTGPLVLWYKPSNRFGPMAAIFVQIGLCVS